MAALSSLSMPVVLRAGDTEEEIGEIEIPLTVRYTTRHGDAVVRDGLAEVSVEVELDGREFRRRLACLLREAATHLESEAGPGDAEGDADGG